MRSLKVKCLVARAVTHPKVFSRWLRIKWVARVRMIEAELGERLECC